MKPIANTISTHSTIGGETRAMSIDASAMAHIMGVLTNLYSDPIMAVIREYSTNALDATIEAGSAQPIIVSLPTNFAPHLSIQDFGIGMSTDTILDHYSLYGRSDKRGSNDQVGMLGLGCKSALTYANSFTITSVRNGVKTVANIAKNHEGIGEIEIVDTVSTRERNGTRINIPVKTSDIDKFAGKARELFGYWTPGTVLIDGAAPIYNLTDFHKVEGMDVYFKKNYEYSSTHTVVMGNVPYRASTDIFNEFNNRALRVFVPIGAVSFAPSREELMFNNKTNDYLKSLIAEVKVSIQKQIEDVLSTATTKIEAFSLRGKYSDFNFLRSAAWKFQGESIPENVSGVGFRWSPTEYPRGKARVKRGWSQSAGGTGRKKVFISNYPSESLSRRIKDALITWSQDVNHPWFNVEEFVFTRDPNPWIEWTEWDSVKKSLPKIDKSAKKVNNCPDTWIRSGKIINSSDHVTDERASDQPDETYYMVSPEQFKNMLDSDYNQIRAAGFIPVLVYVREQAAFADDFLVANEDSVREWKKSLDTSRSDDWYLYRAFTDSSLMRLRGQKTLDPELNRLLSLTNKQSSKDIYAQDGGRFDRARLEVAAVAKRYPLIVRYDPDVQTLIEYVDAIYSYRKEN